ncbi:gliding motility-associated C-terminal domain-containing protein [Maribacter sp. MAR_2009_72]|uniref:gliding motility-associated C-terminal domain-containing protein n=1 Tax=Maribacter sp. MAR_2009_72 TaxID=1250050 RepID=UPI00119C84AF|nr:gliding motility-associated C-terminal domain-containing protein [Maribacter sp. MAR_2009_72]TVZ15217.1 gliding motility-associated-like protein [Maribacter sp. MAR_2009_72]
MNKLHLLIFFLIGSTASAQTALYNNGNLRIHEGGSLGFHTNLINAAPMDGNLGLTGFYGTAPLMVSGEFTPQFHDVEIAVENDLLLALGVNNSNNTNFILGNVRTPLTQPEIFYTFLDDSFYTGENDLSKVEGYAAITNKQEFIFPIGDRTFLRPLIIRSTSINLFVKCAYFYEDANNPNSFPGTYNTLNTALDIELVSDQEFWRLEGNVPSTVSLTYNARSGLQDLTDDVTKIIPVGYSKLSGRWVNLAGSAATGTVNEGIVSTEEFVPDDYEILTLGVSKIPYEPLSKEVLTLDNYIVSANGDGINDTFFIPEIMDKGNNLVQIYDRYGLKVFEFENYTNEFIGFSNLNNIPLNAEKGLPAGVYFYTIALIDEKLNYQGFLYLAR